MRDDTRRRLTRAIWLDRAKKLGIALAIAGGIGLVFAFESLDLAVTNARVGGKIEAIEPLVAKGTAAAEGVTVAVLLNDGRHVRVLAEKKRDPHIGDAIEVTEHRHATGRITYTLK